MQHFFIEFLIGPFFIALHIITAMDFVDSWKNLGKKSLLFWLLWFSSSYWHKGDLGVPSSDWFIVRYV